MTVGDKHELFKGEPLHKIHPFIIICCIGIIGRIMYLV